MQSEEIIFALLRSAMGAPVRDALPDDVSWQEVYRQAMAQNVLAVAFDGLQRLKEAGRVAQVDEGLYYAWLGQAMLCEQDTARVSAQGVEALAYFRKAGFECCILKGSGLGQLYDRPEHRSVGDIDVWLAGGRKRVFDFAKSVDPKGQLHGVNYHHVHFHLFEDTLIEGHIYPSWFTNPLLNKRWMRFCEMHRPTNQSDTPSLAFNRVFVLLHIFHHYGGHGINLKQVMDYAYVLRQGCSPEEKAESSTWLRRLHLERFAAGMMWLLQHDMGLDEGLLLVAPDEKEGRRIREELLAGCTPIAKSPLWRFVGNTKRDMRLAWRYPHTTLWNPAFSIWLYLWRLMKGYLNNKD